MILIISTFFDNSTSIVINWLNKYGVSYTRVNDFDFEKNNTEFSYCLNKQHIVLNGIIFSEINVTSVWYRRFSISNLINNELANRNGINKLGYKLNDFIHKEKHALKFALSNVLGNARWLNKPHNSSINKLYQLKCAAEIGLKIPYTLISTSKKETKHFFELHGEIIVKPISDISPVNIEGNNYSQLTTKLMLEKINLMKDYFFPILVQSLVEKEFEIRTFFLNDEFYSMAMFTQTNDKTKVDFRNYDYTFPNRRVPYKLPNEVEHKLTQLMHLLDLNSGSIDIIYSTTKEYIFLEVNPVGQFGMVSYPCNYNLEKKIATYLLHERLDKANKRKHSIK